MQIDDPRRGFSYKHDGPLDMRMDVRRAQTAADLLATITQHDLASALRDLADEPDARAIAAAVVRRREQAPLRRTSDLVQVVLAAKGIPRRALRAPAAPAKPQPHPASRTFQTLRILVNEELTGLEQLLRVAPFCLRPGARMAVISFHSGEDRIVESALQRGADDGTYAEVSPEPLRPTAAERRSNPRCSSAKLRWARRAC